MSIQTGTQLGPYKVHSLIGKGGMGQVYRAEDTRLGRAVALKVLAPELSQKPVIRERFLREARAISRVAHPNICALYDVGNEDGIDYLVMELLEGENLAMRLRKGPLPQDQLLRRAIEIADALAKAHRHGIIHRDLKPGNIFLTASGAKLLDFGLAKLREPEMSLSVAQTEAGRAEELTMEGTILGTVQYMSPEQLEGKAADHRTDIFAFGMILYEMATGKKAFEGSSYASLIAAILSTKPTAITLTAHAIPASLDRVIMKCLAKDPEERWQSAQDLASELRWIAEGGAQRTFRLSGTKKWFSERNVLRVLALALLAAVAGLAITAHRKPSPVEPIPLTKLSVLMPPDSRNAGPVALSHNGRKLVFTAINGDGSKSLWIRNLESLESKPIAGTEDAVSGFWSPDDRFLAFFTQSKLKKIQVGGGPAENLWDVSGAKGGTWNQENTLLFAPTFTGGLYRMPAQGGKATPLTKLDAALQESSHRWPWFLPDGKHFLYVVLAAQRERCGTFVGSLDDANLKKHILNDFSRVEYVAPGYLIFSRGSTLVAQAFDVNRLELKGDTLSLGEKVGYDGYSGYAAFSTSDNGSLAFGMIDQLRTQLAWYDRSGKKTSVLGDPADYREMAFSPDESKVVLERADTATGNNDLWIVDLVRGSFSRFTFEPSNEVAALWSPDGSKIAYCSNPEGIINLYQKSATASSTPELVVASADPKYPDDWSADGKFILYESSSQKTKFDLWYVPMVGEHKPLPFLQTQFNETHGRFSPDGKWIAFSSDESGRSEIYLRRFPPSGDNWQISTEGGDQVQWRKDGKELIYLSADKKLMTVPFTSGDSPKLGVPHALFSTLVYPNSLVDNRNQYVTSADGNRFLFIEKVDPTNTAPIEMILNWPAALTQ